MIAVAAAVALTVFLIVMLPRGGGEPVFSAAPELFDPVEEVPGSFRDVTWMNGNWELRIGDEPGLHPVVVPHSWASVPGLEAYRGTALYRVRFKVPEEWEGGRVIINFGGVGGAAKVSVNGNQVVTHEGCYMPFSAGITEHLNFESDNLLEVEVDNRGGAGVFAGERCYGGIYREVYLELRKELELENMVVRAQPSGGASATVSIRADLRLEPDGTAQVFGSVSTVGGLKKAGFDVMVNADENGFGGVSWEGEIGDAELWSAGNPVMYRAAMVVITPDAKSDGMDRMFGIRKFEPGGGGFYLNGSRVRLDGVVWREQFPGGWGPVVTREAIKKDIELIRFAKFNAVRFTHPVHPAMLRACDNNGLLVFEEMPVSGGSAAAKGLDARMSEYRERVLAMVNRDRHHPSIVAWGLGCDLRPDSGAVAKSLERIADAVRALDPDREVYIGMRGVKNLRRAAGSDFAAFADYPGWTGGALTGFSRLPGRAEFGDVPAVMLGFGAAAETVRGPAGLKGTELHQYYVVRAVREALDADERIAGRFVDSLTDYMGPALDPRGGHDTVRTGLLTLDRKPRLVFDWITGLDENEIAWEWSRIPFRLHAADVIALLFFAMLGFAIWSGYSKVWPALIEPDALGRTGETARELYTGFALFGLPMLLIAAAAGSLAVSALMQSHPPDAALLPPGAITAMYSLFEPFSMRITALFVVQVVWLLAAGIAASLLIGGQPLRVFELLARCTALRLLLVAVPFLPFAPWVIPALIFGWEIVLQGGTVSRVCGIGIRRAYAAVIAAHAACGLLVFALARLVIFN